MTAMAKITVRERERVVRGDDGQWCEMTEYQVVQGRKIMGRFDLRGHADQHAAKLRSMQQKEAA